MKKKKKGDLKTVVPKNGGGLYGVTPKKPEVDNKIRVLPKGGAAKRLKGVRI